MPMRSGTPAEVFLVFLRLGLTSFGGPIAHIGYFREAIVARRRWLDDAAYADLVALAQLLPGPASSQVGLGIGLYRAGYLGALAAWCGFTLPSAVLMIAFGYGILSFASGLEQGVLQGFKIAAVAVVAQAVLAMARSHCRRPKAMAVAGAAAVVTLGLPALLPGTHSLLMAQLLSILGGALVGWLSLEGAGRGESVRLAPAVSQRTGLACLAIFAALLLILPVAAQATGTVTIAVFDAFYRAGALVFGGGHVVLPLLHGGVTEPGWVDAPTFMAGYGAAQAVPGPLFTFAAYLGTVLEAGSSGQGQWPGGWLGGLVALAAIFLGSGLLVIGAMPFWDRLRAARDVRGAMAGINAAVVGLLLAALYDPVITAGVRGPLDAALAGAGLALLMLAKLPSWALVAVMAVAGFAIL